MLKKSANGVLARHSRLTKTLGAYRLDGVHKHGALFHRAVRLIILRVADLAEPCLWNGAAWRVGVASREFFAAC